MNLDVLTDAVGTATLASACRLAPAAVRRLACDAALIPVVLDGAGLPLDVGQAKRLVQPHQRTALIARDKGCAHPGCIAPARWTDAHHITWWQHGGDTDLHNLVLLCKRHHRMQHHGAWQVRMASDGRPEFIPPKWIDPDQKPLRNTIRQ